MGTMFVCAANPGMSLKSERERERERERHTSYFFYFFLWRTVTNTNIQILPQNSESLQDSNLTLRAKTSIETN
jgi:hypothetical protein